MKLSPRPLLLLVAAHACTMPFVHADTIAYDGAGPGDSGWSAQWTAEPTTVSTALVYPGLTTAAGSFLINNTRMTRSLGATIGGDGSDRTVWLSFLGYRTSATTNDSSDYAFNVGLSNGSTDDVIGVGGYRSAYTTAGDTTNDNPSQWAVTALNGTATVGTRTSNSTYSANAAGADFILLKIDYNVATGTDSLSLWINPSVAAGESGLGLTTAQMNNLDLGSFDRIRLYAGPSATFNVDEIRLANSFETVIPEPSTYALLLGAGALGMLRFRRRARAHAD